MSTIDRWYQKKKIHRGILKGGLEKEKLPFYYYDLGKVRLFSFSERHICLAECHTRLLRRDSSFNSLPTTSANVKESVFKDRLKILHFSFYFPNPFPDPEPCLVLQSPVFYGVVLLHLSVLPVLSACLFIYFVLSTCSCVVMLAESTLLTALLIHEKFKCELLSSFGGVCGSDGGIDLHLHTWQSRQVGRSPQTMLWWKINWYLA